ncbi:uncharacterized protein DFL_006580 [Arthrobotrys flagrans]|uniref:Uncharacterized protein n=1 Tax=Arthrobotrys flagrans TaxID=97331 RepID=A0A436ZTR5_ARTFL|nr:hypothetical protein DFL_006580 [Arthrobotrys flagrans]
MEEVSNDRLHFWGGIDGFYSDDAASTAHRNSVSSRILASSPSETPGNYTSPRFRETLSPMMTDFPLGNFIGDTFQDNVLLYSPSSQIPNSPLHFAFLERSDSSSSLDQVVHGIPMGNIHRQSAEESLWDQLQKVKTKSTFLCDWMDAVLEFDMDPALHGYSKHHTSQYPEMEFNRQAIMVDNPDIYDHVHVPLHPINSVTSKEPTIGQHDTEAKSLQETDNQNHRGSGGSERKQIKRKTAPNRGDDGAVSTTKKPRYISMRDIKETLGFSHSDGRSDNENDENTCRDGAGWQRMYSNWRKDIASMAVAFVSLEAFTKSAKYKDSEVDSNNRRLNVIHGTFKWRGWNEMSESEQKGFLKSAFRLPWFGVTHSSAKIDEWIKNGFSSTVGENNNVNAIVDAAKTVILDVFKKRKDGMKSAYIEAYIDGIIEMDANGMISARLRKYEEGCREGNKFDQGMKPHQNTPTNSTNPTPKGQDLPVRYLRFYPDDDPDFTSNSLDAAYPYEPDLNLFASLGRLNTHSARIADIQLAMVALDTNSPLRRILGTLKSDDGTTKLRMPISSDRELQAWLMANIGSRTPFDIYCIFQRNPATNGGRADSPPPRHSRYLN